MTMRKKKKKSKIDKNGRKMWLVIQKQSTGATADSEYLRRYNGTKT